MLKKKLRHPRSNSTKDISQEVCEKYYVKIEEMGKSLNVHLCKWSIALVALIAVVVGILTDHRRHAAKRHTRPRPEKIEAQQKQIEAFATRARIYPQPQNAVVRP